MVRKIEGNYLNRKKIFLKRLLCLVPKGRVWGAGIRTGESESGKIIKPVTRNTQLFFYYTKISIREANISSSACSVLTLAFTPYWASIILTASST